MRHDHTAILETDRLILRRPELVDLNRWAEMMQDAETCRFIGGVTPKPLVWRTIAQMVGAWELTGVSMFSVVEKSTGLWIGRVGPWSPFGWPGDEVGWALRRDTWGKGYAVEAAAACMNYAFNVLEWSEVVHCIDPHNTRSQSVARRLGSTVWRQAPMPAPFDDHITDVWDQTREQWHARSQGGAL